MLFRYLEYLIKPATPLPNFFYSISILITRVAMSSFRMQVSSRRPPQGRPPRPITSKPVE